MLSRKAFHFDVFCPYLDLPAFFNQDRLTCPRIRGVNALISPGFYTRPRALIAGHFWSGLYARTLAAQGLSRRFTSATGALRTLSASRRPNDARVPLRLSPFGHAFGVCIRMNAEMTFGQVSFHTGTLVLVPGGLHRTVSALTYSPDAGEGARCLCVSRRFSAASSHPTPSRIASSCTGYYYGYSFIIWVMAKLSTFGATA